MITLQNFVFPEPGICSENELYFRAEGAVGLSYSRGEFRLSPGSQLSFDSYFNLFNLGKWTAACDLDGVFLELTGAGLAEIRVHFEPAGRSGDVIYCEPVTLTKDAPHIIALSDLLPTGANGVVYVKLTALEDGVTLSGGRFFTGNTPDRLPRLAISITTFKREADVRDTVARLESFLADFPYRDQVRLQVVDNGQSADIQPSDITTPYTNPNLGGAGGFARGLIEAEDAGCSHCLFMDDDASFHMENIARCYAFLTLARDPNAALAGAMINTTVKWAMWENGAVFNVSCRPLHTGVDLRERDQLLDMEFDSVHDDYPTLYGAWWFFAFPIAAARHYPFPFFVRGDDISFSLANDFRISTLNGVVSFQEDFTEKESAQTLYLDLRNHLLHHLIFDSLSRSAFGTAWVAVLFIVRSLLRFHYSSAEAQLLALQDVMQGPGFFDENLDMADRRARIRDLARDEEWQPIGTVDLSERHRVFSRLPAPIRHYFGLITINGHLIPFWPWLGSRLVLRIGQRGLVDESFGAARLTFLNTARDKAYSLPHSKRRFFGISWRLAGTLLRYLRIHRALKDQYRDQYPDMTSRAYWEKALDRG